MEIVVAVDSNWGIGLNGTQNVVIPEDRKHFRSVTGNGTVVLGRRTLEDFPDGKPLKNRRNIVLTGNKVFSAEGAEAVHSLEELLETVRNCTGDVFVIGGGSVYRQLLPYCTAANVTKMETTADSDTFFPDLDNMPQWRIADEGEILVSRTGIRYRFVKYVNSEPMKY